MAVNPNGGFWDSRDGDREYTQEDFNNVITAHFSDGVARLGTQVSVLDSLKPSALGTQVTLNAGMVYIAGYWYVSKESQTVDLGANQYLVARLNLAGRKIEILSSNTVEDSDVALYGKVEGDMRVESAPILANQQKQVIDTNVGELILDSTSDTYHSLLNVWDSLTHTQEALFKPQNATSFQMLNPSRITVRGGYIYLDLGSFKSTVGVNSFPVYQYSSGVRPSAAIDLGAIGVLAGASYAKTGKWNTDGSIYVGPSMSANDYLITLPRVIPVPAGVTFS
jgi:hypothetical protein